MTTAQPGDLFATQARGSEPAGESFCDRLAHYFRQRPGEWISGRELSQIGGFFAWRTRVSELRRAPYFMDIDNRVRQLPGSKAKLSEYRLIERSSSGIDLDGVA